MKKNELTWLAEGGLMIALSIVLEVVSKMFIPGMPFGGHITAASMLPVIIVGWKYGIGKGLVTGIVYALVEIALGANTIGAMILPSSEDYLGNIGKVVLMILLDYIIAFTVIGLSGMYKNVIKNNALSLALGAFTVIVLRYLCHVVSGYILFGSYAEWFFTQDGFPAWGQAILAKYNGQLLSLIYSLIYNATFMLPEAIITTIAAGIIGNVPQVMGTKSIK